ncbi:MAG: hypothetical protein WDM76_02670 [Limisphaerales bacterium]
MIPRKISAPNLTRKTAWLKVSKRREMDISTVAGAFVVDLDSQNVVRHARTWVWRRGGNAVARKKN